MLMKRLTYTNKQPESMVNTRFSNELEVSTKGRKVFSTSEGVYSSNAALIDGIG